MATDYSKLRLRSGGFAQEGDGPGRAAKPGGEDPQVAGNSPGEEAVAKALGEPPAPPVEGGGYSPAGRGGAPEAFLKPAGSSRGEGGGDAPPAAVSPAGRGTVSPGAPSLRRPLLRKPLSGWVGGQGSKPGEAGPGEAGAGSLGEPGEGKQPVSGLQEAPAPVGGSALGGGADEPVSGGSKPLGKAPAEVRVKSFRELMEEEGAAGLVGLTPGVGGEEAVEPPGGGALERVALPEELREQVRARRAPGEVRARRRVARDGARVRKHSGRGDHGKPVGGWEASMAQAGPGEVLVDGEGRVVARGGTLREAGEFARLVEAAEGHRPVRVEEAFLASAAEASEVVLPRDREVVVYPWAVGGSVSPAGGGGAPGGGRKLALGAEEAAFFRRLRSAGHGLESGARRRAGGAQAAARRKPGRGSRGLVTLEDQEVVAFLVLFKYATARQVARLRGVSEVTAERRLRALRDRGLVTRAEVWGTKPLWFVTQEGLLMSGYDLPVVTAKTFTYTQLPHQFVVNNTAANLWGGHVNVLALDDFPGLRRVDKRGLPARGEALVAETEIQSSLARMRGLASSDVYRPKIMEELTRAFAIFFEDGGVEAGLVSPEFLRGNEWMWALYPPFMVQKKFHVPDLVVKRERTAAGPEAIAVEVEAVKSKERHKYNSTLRAYFLDKLIYKKVVWVCRTRSTMMMIEEEAKKVGLWQEGRCDIVPIVTENGEFGGGELWTL